MEGLCAMTNDTVQARVSPELKRAAEDVFSAIGLKTSDAIRLFLQQAVNSGGLPFRLTAKRPNAGTLAALRETGFPERLSEYESFEEFRKELDS
jgi:DNA-damage-inducible protein J